MNSNNNALLKGIIILATFFGMWIALSQINFRAIFKVDKAVSATEEGLGKIIWNEIERTENVIYDKDIVNTLDSLLIPLCEKNDIEKDSLKVYIIQKDEINAFALPDNYMVVYTGLINDCKNEEALLGVLGHEIAHLEENHVMKKLSKEIGFSVLMSMTGSNAQVIKEVVHTLSSSAYDRTLEREADMKSIDYMINAEIDPKPFIDFMYNLSLETDNYAITEWVSSHPESEERAQYMLNFIKNKKIESKKILSEENWEQFKQNIKDNQ